MRTIKVSVGAWILVLGLSVACGSDGSNTDENMSTPGGTGGTPPSAAAGTTPQTAAGTSAPSGTAGSAPMAGRNPTPAGTGSTSAGSPAAPSGGTGTTAGGTPATAGTGTATAGSSGTGTAGTAGTAAPMAGTAAPPMTGGMGKGMCCPDGDCLCHGDPPSAPTNMPGPFKTAMFERPAGCVFYPMDAEPPFAAVSVSDGFGGAGGCRSIQTGQWGPLYASWGIVAMIINTGAGDQPPVRGQKLSAAIEAFKMENTKAGSPLMGKLSGRYGTSGLSMGGGGTTFSGMNDALVKSTVSILAWQPATSGITVPSLFIFGSSDTLAGTMGMSAYRSISGTVPKMTVTINSPHAGQPSSGGGASGKAGLAFQ